MSRLETVSKEIIIAAADHSDIGGEHLKAIVKFLREQKRKVKKVFVEQHKSKDDSYVEIAETACSRIRRCITDINRQGCPDSAVLIDQFGTGMCSVANVFVGIIASVAWSPKIAYEVTRKNNPRVLCVPIYTSENGELIELSPEYTVNIVNAWLNTEFLDGIRKKDQQKYIDREEANRRIHISSINNYLRSRSGKY